MGGEPNYQRGYSKGYNTGVRQIADVRQEYQDAVDAFRERAERAEAGLGLGLCQDCKHWQRGNDGAAKWGLCGLTDKMVTWPWPWRGDPDQQIHTQERFGCVRFAGSSPAGAAKSSERDNP